MRRTSRKKQDTSSSREVVKAPPPVAGGVRRQHPPPEVLQQRKKHQDEVQSLTTKNYRLAKELVCLCWDAQYCYPSTDWKDSFIEYTTIRVLEKSGKHQSRTMLCCLYMATFNTWHSLLSFSLILLFYCGFKFRFQADLRLKHRDECKHVNRLTMENVSYIEQFVEKKMTWYISNHLTHYILQSLDRWTWLLGVARQ